MSVDFDMADIKPNMLNLATIFLAVLITVPVAKWLFNERLRVPGVTDLVNMI